METTDVVNLVSGISIGTVIAWITVIFGVLSAIVAVSIKLYKVFERAHKITEEHSEFKNLVKSHDEQLKTISNQISYLQKSIDDQKKDELAKCRYDICRAGEEYLSNGSLTIRQLKSLEEMFDRYHTKHGNGYVTTLMRKVRTLPVVGKLDENDEDIDDDDNN